MTDLTSLTLAAALDGMEKKQFSSVELTDAFLTAIERANSKLNAYVALTPDAARAAAKASDKRRASAQARALEGAPLGIKDLFCTEGVRTTAGSNILGEFAPTYESTGPDEVVFAKNATEAINLVAYAFGNASVAPKANDERFVLRPGDEIVVTEMEHHSNIVPWQMLCERTGATFKWFGITDDGYLDLSRLDEMITERTKLVSIAYVSNTLGTINDPAPIIARARQVGALVMLDGSQAVPQMPVDVAALDLDFLAFTGHKMAGPTGIGVLWARSSLLSAMPPFLGGGSMIETVTMAKTTYAPPPARFEAGTPPIAEAIALGTAIDYLTGLDMRAVAAHERGLTTYALDALSTVEGLRVYGPTDAADRGGTMSFALDGVHPHDVGQILDEFGVEVRVGHHCARPVCARFGVAAMTRASFYVYTTTHEIDELVHGLEHVRKVFA